MQSLWNTSASQFAAFYRLTELPSKSRKVRHLLSGTPAFDGNGKLAVGDFPAQMKQVMDNVTATLKASGAGWDRVAKTTVLLMRSGDFAEMNRIYATYFPDGKYPARTTVVVAGLPHPDFLLEIECEAITE